MSNERLVRNAALPRKTHVSVKTTYAIEQIECGCGAVIRAEPDAANHEAHGPLLAAWQAHCREAG